MVGGGGWEVRSGEGDDCMISASIIKHSALEKKTPASTGIPFNDADRYMDWLLTMPLLLFEILLVMKLDEATFSRTAWVFLQAQ